MGLNSVVSIGGNNRQPNSLEKVVAGLDIASKILGLGLSGVALYQKTQDAGLEERKQNAAEALNFRAADKIPVQTGMDQNGSPIMGPKPDAIVQPSEAGQSLTGTALPWGPQVGEKKPLNINDYEKGALVLKGGESQFGNQPVVPVYHKTLGDQMLQIMNEQQVSNNPLIQAEGSAAPILRNNMKQILGRDFDPQKDHVLSSKEAYLATKTAPQVNAALNQGIRQKEFGINQGVQTSNHEESDAQALMKQLDTEKASGRFTPVGKAQSNIYQAQRINALFDQYKDPNQMPLTGPSSLSEVAIGLNSLLSSTGGSEESRKSLIPSSLRGHFSTVEQFLSNGPTPAQMGEFVKNAKDTLNREILINQKQIDSYKNKIVQSNTGSRLARSNPDRFNNIVDSYLSAAPELSAPVSNNKPKQIIQNGHTYILNEQSGQYE